MSIFIDIYFFLYYTYFIKRCFFRKKVFIMEFRSNQGKNVEIEVNGQKYLRHAIETHYVQIGENYIDIIEKYVKPIYQEGDFISISEKIIGLCQKRVVYKKDVKVSGLAKFLSKFAMRSDAGVGVDNPYKMQFAIMLNGRLKVIWAAIAGGFGKLFGKRGIFYKIVGPEVSGLDGFYGDVFEDYAEFGIRIPENSSGVCNEIYEKTGVKAMIVDANDFNVEILGKSDTLEYSDEELAAMIKDNPAGQAKTLTPIILVRKAEQPEEVVEETTEEVVEIEAQPVEENTQEEAKETEEKNSEVTE